MANHKSAAKRARQDLKRRERNRAARAKVRTLVKRFRDAAASGDRKAADERFALAERALRKAASKGVIPKTRASRSVSRLARTLGRV